ncbi:MAG: hypothetical protein JNJ45_11280 [Chthonomonas sp.]|nr:hypothetical protein [Chthonomonas sp.]
MKLTSLFLVAGALMLGVVGCKSEEAAAPAAEGTTVASNSGTPTKDSAEAAKGSEEAKPAAATEAGKPAPQPAPTENPNRGTAPDAPGDNKNLAKPMDSVQMQNAPKPMENPPKSMDRYATPKGDKVMPTKPGGSGTEVTSEPVRDKTPKMVALKNWKAPAATGNFKPYAGTWALQVGPKMQELNAKLKKEGKAVPRFEFVLNPNGTFKFSQGKRVSTGVIQVKGQDIMLMPTAINGEKPKFEQDVKPYVFQSKGGAMIYMLGGRPGSKFVKA